MMKRRSLLLVALVLFSVSLFAAPVVVTWEWMLEDPNVTTFRYQIDGEDPDGWIVVDSSVTSYTVKGLEGSQAYTLYLQQSYDGENFSGSATAVSEPIFPPEPVVDAQPVVEAEEATPVADEPVVAPEPDAVSDEPVALEAEEVVATDEPVVVEAEKVVATEEPVAIEAEEVVVTDEPVVVAEVEPVVEAKPLLEAPAVTEAPVAKEKAESRFGTTITLGGGPSNMCQPVYSAPMAVHNWNLKAELGLQLKNMMTFNKAFGLGMDVGIAYTPYLASSRAWRDVVTDIFSNFSGVVGDLTHAGTLSVAPMLNMQLGKVSFDLGGGGFITYGPKFNSTKNEKFMYGAFAKAALAYQFNNWFSMGVDAKYNFVLVDFNSIAKFAEAGIFMGFSF